MWCEIQATNHMQCEIQTLNQILCKIQTLDNTTREQMGMSLHW